MKVGAVFEEDGDEADSWEGKSVEADVSSGGQNFSIGSMPFRGGDAEVASLNEENNG